MKPPARIPTRTEITNSAEFRAFCEAQSQEAQRRRDDRMAEVEGKRTEIARSKADHENFALRTEAEIADILSLVEDDERTIDAAAAALGAGNRPTLSARKETQG